MEDERISYHASVRTMYTKLQEDGMSNVWDRYEAQGFGSVPTAHAALTQRRTNEASAGYRPTASR